MVCRKPHLDGDMADSETLSVFIGHANVMGAPYSRGKVVVPRVNSIVMDVALVGTR